MRVILKNLFTALRRYPAAVALNVAGLAVAFAAFLVILIEVRFEYGFDTCHPGSERIFRVEMRSPELADSWFTMLNYPLISDLAGSSAHIEAASALEMLGPGLELEVPEPNGERRLFRETVKRCNSSFVRVLGLRLTEGDAAGLNTSAGLLLPRSLARRMFGDEPAVGRIVRIGGGDLHGLRRICGPACQFGLSELDLPGRLRFRFRALPVVPQLHVFHPPRFAGLA